MHYPTLQRLADAQVDPVRVLALSYEEFAAAGSGLTNDYATVATPNAAG